MQERVGKSNQFDVVLLDLVMPGMGGLEMLRMVRTDPSLRPLSDIPIVVLSGADMHGLNDAIEAGAEDVRAIACCRREVNPSLRTRSRPSGARRRAGAPEAVLQGGDQGAH